MAELVGAATAVGMEYQPVTGAGGAGVGRGVVVLMGWLGAKPRALRKYAKLYNDMGFSVLMLVASPLDLMVLPYRLKRVAERIVDFLRILEKKDKGNRVRVLLATFSNGGYFVYQSLVAIAKEEELFREGVAGLICDSSPCYLHVGSGRKALHVALGGGVRGCLVSSLWWLSNVALAVPLIMINSFRPWNFWEFVLRGDAIFDHLPRLFLYSEDDPLCDPGKLREAIAAKKLAREAMGIEGGGGVRAVLFPSPSGHVSHYRSHPAKYVEAVSSFLNAYLPQSKL